MLRIGALACLEVKMIGKPYALVGHVRFDEGGQDFYLWTILNGHEAGNGGYSQGLSLKKVAPVLYSTQKFIVSARSCLLTPLRQAPLRIPIQANETSCLGFPEFTRFFNLPYGRKLQLKRSQPPALPAELPGK
jgi:hypothetical protein